jgi:hypothetical protein
MRPEDIKTHVKAEPFQPFRIHLSNGSYYDVRHPEMIMVGASEVVIATRLRPDGVAGEFAYCRPLHITHLENLPERKGRTRRANG